MMGVPARYFGVLFLTTVIGYIAGSAISTRLAHGRESEQVMWLGAQLALAAGSVMLCSTSIWFHPAAILLPMSAYSMALGIVLPHAMAAALRPFPHMAATASALFGFIQMGLSAMGGALVGLYLVDTATPMLLVIFTLSVAAWCLIRRLQAT
jgi:DHA1 family bicyclomycin/chloramphenicol resistance-like MFS transporter